MIVTTMTVTTMTVTTMTATTPTKMQRNQKNDELLQE